MALSGSTISNCNENNQGSVGILLEQGTSEYLLYSDNNNSNFCENGGGTCSSADATCQDTGGVNEWMEGISMTGDVWVDYVCYFDTGSSSCDSFSTISTAKVSILFIAPDPIIRICDETGYCGYRSITVMFRSPDPSVGSSGITMDTGGRIQRQ